MSTPRRIRILGASGSGKTSLARAVAARTGLAHLELDAVFWDREWTFRACEEAHDIIRRFVTEHPDGWVMDGNWQRRLDGRLAWGQRGPDTVVWLDHPRRVVMARVLRRTFVRGITRRELWHGNRERMRTWLRWKPEENIVRFAWTQHAAMRDRMQSAIAAGEPILRLSGQREVDAWLASLSSSEPPATA